MIPTSDDKSLKQTNPTVLKIKDLERKSSEPLETSRSERSSKKEILFRSLRTSKAHGISNLVESSHLSLQTMWAILLALSFGGLVYLLIYNTTSYLKYGVVT